MQYSDLMGAGGELLADHKDKWVKDAAFVELLMNSDASSHAVPVSSTQDQLQLPRTRATANFTREMRKTMKLLTGFGSEMALELESKSAVSRGVSPSVCVHACLSVSAWCPLGVTRDVQGPDPTRMTYKVCIKSVRPRVRLCVRENK